MVSSWESPRAGVLSAERDDGTPISVGARA